MSMSDAASGSPHHSSPKMGHAVSDSNSEYGRSGLGSPEPQVLVQAQLYSLNRIVKKMVDRLGILSFASQSHVLDVDIRNNYESKHAKKELQKELGLRADSPPLDKRDTNVVREYQPAVGSYDLDSVYAQRLRICCKSM